ncbi:signal peptide containing protein [Theileria equi strain WA]|uniref:Signal peptide containing protein n=1 Tax=Theileria equi strain WA TaxID=1537102 RepID=L1LB44_THEEQ|nr:signal peptide containing protein [Theileria equi strain WA]EKX72368.1 signal peptide containing protein [Theileria equi strain WA]|eukprot:XP_004831820.1 signal peptide containing protein [Theileria equi strain WA]
MRILALLWMLFLARFCSACCMLQCLWKKINGKLCNKDDDDDVYVQVAQGSSNEFPNVPFLPGVIDISALDKKQCKFFNYSFAGNAIRLVVPNKGVSVSKLMNGSETVWIAEEEETFGYAEAYLNHDGKPELILVASTSSGTSKETYLELKDGRWVSCNDSEDKMKSLRDPAEWKSDFEIDISASKDTDKCSIFEVGLLGVTTRHFYPEPGHVPIKVKNGNKELWKAQVHSSRKGMETMFGGYESYCLSCILYKKGSMELLELTVVGKASSRWYKYFEKNADGQWKSISEKDYDKKFNEIKRAKPSQVPSKAQPKEDSAVVVQTNFRNVAPKLVTRLGITLDLSNPDPSLFSLADDQIHGVSHKAFVPKDGCSLVAIVDNRDTLWTATDTKEECMGAYLFSREGYSSLLSVYTRGAGDETFCFEKNGSLWKNVDKRYFERKLHSMKDFSAPAGEGHKEEDT